MSDAVKERPILFSGPMVNAILDGRKTQTRRVIKPQPTVEKIDGGWRINGVCHFMGRAPDHLSRRLNCPYGKPGTRLWVRESFGYFNTGRYDRPEMGHYYKATDDPGMNLRWWRPSIHMPRALSRLTLKIVSVRVERVQDISQDDAKAEGVLPLASTLNTEQIAFRLLWDDINGKRTSCAWSDNPWVWVIEFRKVNK